MVVGDSWPLKPIHTFKNGRWSFGILEGICVPFQKLAYTTYMVDVTYIRYIERATTHIQSLKKLGTKLETQL